MQSINHELKTFGDKLRFIRWYARMSQRELGEEIGCSQVTMSHYEKNTSTPAFKVLKKLDEFVRKNQIPVSLF